MGGPFEAPHTNQLTRRARPCQKGSRSLNFWSLPVAVRGKPSRNSTEVGHLKWASRAAEGHELLGSGAPIRAQHHQSLDGLPPLLVGYANDRCLGHRRMLVEAVLDLDRGNILAARDDYVLLAV